MNKIINTDRINTDEAAAMIGVKPATLINWRCTKKQTVPYYKMGGRVFYKKTDIDEWVESKKVS